MSYSLKREIEFYVNTEDSTDGVTKLAILPEVELKIQANLLQVYRKIIGEAPEMLPRSVVDQINPINLGFMTYIRPAQLDGLLGNTAPEKILWDSLGGVEGFRGSEYYQVQFGRVNRLIPLYIFIKTTTAIYKIGKVYIDSVEIAFDIDYIAILKWTAQAITFDAYSVDDITFTNVKDYTNIENYLRPKFTVVNITDSKDSKVYNFPITESNIKIQNVLMPVYDKNIKVVTGTVKDLIVGGRATNGTIKCYLSSRFKHSKEFLASIAEDLTQVNRKYKISYILTDGINEFSIELPYAIINVPNLDFEDVLNVNIEFTSSESTYGLNNDTIIKYYSKPTELTLQTLIDTYNPSYYYKMDDITGSTSFKNYGSTGTAYNIAKYGAPTFNHAGYYTESKAVWFPSGADGLCNVVKPNIYNAFVSFWWKNPVIRSQSYLFYLSSDVTNLAFGVWRYGDSLRFNFQSNTTASSHLTVNMNSTEIKQWVHIVVYRTTTGTAEVYVNGTLRYSSNVALGNIANDNIALGYYNNSLYDEYLSEVLILVNDEVPETQQKRADFVNILKNSTALSDKFDAPPDFTYNSQYSDSVYKSIGISDIYVHNIKRYNPKAYWRFNDNDSNTVRDHITGAYPLTLYNNPELGREGPLLNDNSSKSMLFAFKGTSTRQTFSSASKTIPFNGTKATWVYWFKAKKAVTLIESSCLIKTGNNSSVTLLYRKTTDLEANNKVPYRLTFGHAYYDCAVGAASTGVYYNLNKDQWYCLTSTFDKTSNKMKLFLDGIKIADGINSNVGYLASPVYFHIQGVNGDEFEISEVAFFDYILSDTAIQGIYASSGITGFNIEVSPSTGNINITGNIPTILRGTGISANSGSIQITGNIPSVSIFTNITAQSGKLLLFGNGIPEIRWNQVISPQVGILNFIGNTPNVFRTKIVDVQTGPVEITGNIPDIYYIVNSQTGNLIITGNIPIIKNAISVKPTSGTLTVDGGSPTIDIFETITTTIHTYIIVRRKR